MASAYICDRCGRMYMAQPDEIYGVTYHRHDTNLKRPYHRTYNDLCPKCGREFYEWLRKPVVKTDDPA